MECKGTKVSEGEELTPMLTLPPPQSHSFSHEHRSMSTRINEAIASHISLFHILIPCDENGGTLCFEDEGRLNSLPMRHGRL
jgi:hypothetical protein